MAPQMLKLHKPFFATWQGCASYLFELLFLLDAFVFVATLSIVEVNLSVWFAQIIRTYWTKEDA